MSADNCIAVLCLKDSFRVIHAQAIENIYWSHITGKMEDTRNSCRIFEYFLNPKKEFSTGDMVSALNYASELEGEYPFVEYGIEIINVDKTWDEIVNEAKEIAEQEITYILKNNKRNIYTFLETLWDVYRYAKKS